MKIPIVQSAKALPDYQVELLFDSGEKRIFDMTSYLNFGVFAELKDPELFKTVRVVFDSIEWANGADLCPETLYDKSLPLGGEMIAAEDSEMFYGEKEND